MANVTYSDFRVEYQARGDKNHLKKFDARSEDSEKTARAFANEQFKAGCKVKLYKLSRVDGEWVREEIQSADGRPEVEKKTSAKSALAGRVAELESRIESLEATIVKLTSVVSDLSQMIAKTSKPRTSKKKSEEIKNESPE